MFFTKRFDVLPYDEPVSRSTTCPSLLGFGRPPISISSFCHSLI